MTTTRIEWTDKTWNPITGCSPISEGCLNCYAKRMTHRLHAMGMPKYKDDFAVRFHPDVLGEPLKWRKPQNIFVCSMGDLFHEEVTNEQIAAVFGVIAACPQHTFQMLTKRARRLPKWNMWAKNTEHFDGNADATCLHAAERVVGGAISSVFPGWPLPNLQLGVTCEKQRTANERVPLLLRCPAAVRFVSVEPMLSAIELTHLDADAAGSVDMCQINALTGRHTDMGRPCRDVPKLDWVICGAETGPGKRPMDLAWARHLRDQCKAAGVPFFFKKATSETPDDLKIREYPR